MRSFVYRIRLAALSCGSLASGPGGGGAPSTGVQALLLKGRWPCCAGFSRFRGGNSSRTGSAQPRLGPVQETAGSDLPDTVQETAESGLLDTVQETDFALRYMRDYAEEDLKNDVEFATRMLKELELDGRSEEQRAEKLKQFVASVGEVPRNNAGFMEKVADELPPTLIRQAMEDAGENLKNDKDFAKRILEKTVTPVFSGEFFRVLSKTGEFLRNDLGFMEELLEKVPDKDAYVLFALAGNGPKNDVGFARKILQKTRFSWRGVLHMLDCGEAPRNDLNFMLEALDKIPLTNIESVTNVAGERVRSSLAFKSKLTAKNRQYSLLLASPPLWCWYLRRHGIPLG